MMNKTFLAITALLFFMYTPSKASIKSLEKSVSSTFKKAGDTIVDVTQKAGDTIVEVAHDIKTTGEEIFDKSKAAMDDITQNAQNILIGEPKPKFCATRPPAIYAPTIENDEVIKKDTEGMIPIIKKYSPVLYLCNERYYPIAAEDYVTAPTTQLVYQPNHKQVPSSPKTIVIPRGQVTMEKIYENRKKYSGKDFFFEIDECTKFGSNPAQFSDGKKNLTTPVYVTWNQYKDKTYIVYVFAYGFNGPYPVNIPGIDVPILKGDISDEQGAHEFDLEHITLELNKDKQLERIFFAAHGRAEGVWYPANHKDIQYEGTHPISHVAINGHGSYPREGTHLRIFGFANDITCKTKKWIPQLVLLYPENDERFNPKTMGWVYHSGEYGRRGVGPMSRFFNGEKDLPKGQPLSRVQFCPNPPKNSKNPLDWAKYRTCIESKRMKAEIPK